MVKPIVAWVWAPHQSRDTGGTTAAASSFLTSRLPTCGPLPCVMTTSWPAAMRPATDSMAAAMAARWASGRGAAVGGGHRVAAQGEENAH